MANTYYRTGYEALGQHCMLRDVHTNKHVDIGLRLRLLVSGITPSTLHGLTVAPLTATELEKLAVAQRVVG